MIKRFILQFKDGKQLSALVKNVRYSVEKKGKVLTYHIQKSSLLQNHGRHVTDFPVLEVLRIGEVTASKSCFGIDLVSTVNACLQISTVKLDSDYLA